MSSWLHQDPARLPPTARRLAWLSARAASLLAPILALVCAVAGVVHLVADVGNYPEPRHRQAVGLLFLVVFTPVTIGIYLLARKRARVLAAAILADRKDPVGRR